eukprot:4649080-Pleurochrysis_carterae.AAC.3
MIARLNRATRKDAHTPRTRTRKRAHARALARVRPEFLAQRRCSRRAHRWRLPINCPSKMPH